MAKTKPYQPQAKGPFAARIWHWRLRSTYTPPTTTSGASR